MRLIEFIEAVRFDISSLLYINLPILLLLITPFNYRRKYLFRKITNIIFYCINIPFILLNNIDIEYIKFTQKRSTSDLIQLLQLGKDAQNIIPQYLKDYWLITLFTIIQVGFLLRLKNIPNKTILLNTKSITHAILIFIISIGLFIIGARGGFQLKPIKPINAGEISNSKNTILILNTPFCILHSINERKIEVYNYFNQKKLDNIYSPIHMPSKGKTRQENIIILIMESYSKEFIGFHNNGIGYTPFLDSLMQHSLCFTNAYSNGLKSIEALPAITASIPALMTNPFITSNYAQNNFKSIAYLLKEEGYNTSFYHGGIRGTMGFYSYSKRAGFTNYFGMEEYNNDKDFDGCWGIYDGPFMKFFAKNLNIKQEPFFSTFFSLSSHPPYSLPKNYTALIKKEYEKIGIKETIKYSDYSMREFFKKVQKQKWFNNTIFIITSDHTASINYNNKYKNKIGRYAIPLIIFKGNNSLSGINTNIVQQIDIMPTILKMINYPKSYFAFGKSMFDESWGVNFLNDEYRLITDNQIIVNKYENYSSYSDWNTKQQVKTDNSYKILLQAIKQDYNNRMTNNNLVYEN